MDNAITESAVPALAFWASATRGAATAVFGVALALFIVTSGVRWVTLGESFYLSEFARYHVGAVTGLSNEDLGRVAHAFVTYFQSPPGRLDIVVNLPEGPQPLLNEREIAHMIEVQGLMHRIFFIWTWSMVTLVISGGIIVAADQSSGGRAVLIASVLGGALAVLTVGALTVASMVNFEQLFWQFHLISFTNDFWLLDPLRDRLIQLYPEGFFYDAALRIALVTVAGGALMLVASIVALRTMER